MAIRRMSWEPEIQLKPLGSRATVRRYGAFGGYLFPWNVCFIYQRSSLWKTINSHLSHLFSPTLHLMRGLWVQEFGPAVKKKKVAFYFCCTSWPSSPANQCAESSIACYVTWKHLSKWVLRLKPLKTRKGLCIHLSDHLNTYMTDTTPYESCFNRKGFSLIISKLITHLVDEAGRGCLEVDHVSYPPCCAST